MYFWCAQMNLVLVSFLNFALLKCVIVSFFFDDRLKMLKRAHFYLFNYVFNTPFTCRPGCFSWEACGNSS